MRRALLMLGVAVVVCVGATQSTFTQAPAPRRPQAPAAPVAAPAITTANVPMPTLTAEEAAAVARAMAPDALTAWRARTAVMAQRAVFDAQERAFREPTADEARALAPAAADTAPVEVVLPSGGAAIKADASSVSLLTATIDQHGRVVTAHGTPGGRHER